MNVFHPFSICYNLCSNHFTIYGFSCVIVVLVWDYVLALLCSLQFFFSIVGYCSFIDAEHALDPALARAIGVDTEKLLLSLPDSGEQALRLVDTLIRSGSVDVVIVDSVCYIFLCGLNFFGILTKDIYI